MLLNLFTSLDKLAKSVVKDIQGIENSKIPDPIPNILNTYGRMKLTYHACSSTKNQFSVIKRSPCYLLIQLNCNKFLRNAFLKISQALIT